MPDVYQRAVAAVRRWLPEIEQLRHGPFAALYVAVLANYSGTLHSSAELGHSFARREGEAVLIGDLVVDSEDQGPMESA